MSQKEWFATWFDSPYYHLLYQHRDDNEAQLFLDNLVQKLGLPSASRVLDLACGKGRHALTLAQMGFQVVGADLAPNSIAAARAQAETAGIKNVAFMVHDMRQTMETPPFAAVFNLFTSFGYFDTLAENQAVCKSVANLLLPEGLLVIDFLNATKVCANLKPAETITREGVIFEIQRWHNQTHIYKQIEVLAAQDKTQIGIFTERVQALSKTHFESLLAPDFDIIDTFGSYGLTAYDEESSDRLIILAKKKP
ncbi:MAG: methyltransferase domain-containing protein [Cryomorphaceae bacterium]|jgi:2-polyprenyl-3-methyl-5-hydroxy-6-metoxy-1,4-benzoquinol methylase|nr:methyltransferase domain-containing protein [Cryomorphaceae bacterium]